MNTGATKLQGGEMSRTAIGWLALLTLTASTAGAQVGSIPTFAYFLNVDRKVLEAYQIQCEQPDARGAMKCKILDILVAPDLNRQKAADQRRSADAEAQKLLTDKGGLAQMCSVQQQLSSVLQLNPGPMAVRFRAAYEKLCKEKSPAAAKAFVLAMIEHAERTCVIGSGGGWQTTFSAQGPHTWVANNGPEGTCGRITIETLEEDPSKPLTWYYTVRKATTAPTNRTLCGQVGDSTMRYEWSLAERAADCEAIKFGIPGM